MHILYFLNLNISLVPNLMIHAETMWKAFQRQLSLLLHFFRLVNHLCRQFFVLTKIKLWHIKMTRTFSVKKKKIIIVNKKGSFLKEKTHLTWSWYYQYLFETEFCLKLVCTLQQRVLHINQVVWVIFSYHVVVLQLIDKLP